MLIALNGPATTVASETADLKAARVADDRPIVLK